MAGQTNRIAAFVFIVVATILCEVYLVSSLPRGYYGFLPRRGKTFELSVRVNRKSSESRI